MIPPGVEKSVSHTLVEAAWPFPITRHERRLGEHTWQLAPMGILKGPGAEGLFVVCGAFTWLPSRDKLLCKELHG